MPAIQQHEKKSRFRTKAMNTHFLSDPKLKKSNVLTDRFLNFLQVIFGTALGFRNFIRRITQPRFIFAFATCFEHLPPCPFTQIRNEPTETFSSSFSHSEKHSNESLKYLSVTYGLSLSDDPPLNVVANDKTFSSIEESLAADWACF